MFTSKNVLLKKKQDDNLKSINELKTNEHENNLTKQSEEEIKLKEMKDKLKKHKFFGENFELEKFLDSGSESNVFKIKCKKNKKDYALKHIFNTKKGMKNIDEIKISSKLKNINVVDFFCYSPSKDDNSQFIIMENAKYGNLRNFQFKSLKRACLSESMLCFIAKQILNGLYYLHRCKIAHMDIKPQNIVIDDYLNAKIIDFSISINYQGKKLSDKLKLPYKGTNFYMPLEVHNTQEIKYKDLNKVDAYALGVLLYNLAFGYYPYGLTYEDSYDYRKIIEKIKKEIEFKNENNFSSQFIDFLSKLLEKDINKRISIYEALEHHWVKGAKILLDEKENLYNINSFVVNLITDNIKKFNDYVKK